LLKRFRQKALQFAGLFCFPVLNPADESSCTKTTFESPYILRMTRLKNILSPVVFTAIMLSACATVPYLNEAREELAAGNWNQALRYANAAAKRSPSDPRAHLTRAMALAEVGVRKPINDRRQYYETFQKTILTADSLARAEDRSGTLSDIRVERINAWVREYNAGVRVLSSKDGVSQEQAAQAAQHFAYAVILSPDSLVGMVMQARAFSLQNDNLRANELLQQAADQDSSLFDRFKMDYALMLQKAGNYIDALPLFEDLFKANPKDFNIGSGLYSCYKSMGLLTAAGAVMEQLFALSPSDETLQFNQGIKAYYDLEEVLRSIDRRAKKEKIPDQDLFKQAYLDQEEQIQKLEYLFTGAANKEKEKPLLQYTPGVYYFNLGVLYSELAPHFTERELRLKFLDVRNELFKRSIPYLKISFGAVSDDKEIWNMLYQMYSTLGMKSEADVALRNATT
jgi:predicted Zn-dependent protease